MCALKKYNPAKKMIAFAIIFFIYLLTSCSVYSDVPVVRNIDYRYLAADKIYRIEYNLDYPGSGTVNISFVVSNDGGENFGIIPISVTGDVGNVLPGSGKRIDWRIADDYPTLNPYNIVTRILAGDEDHNLIYISKGADMVLIPGGTFRMGSYDTPDGMPIYGDELPDHEVSVDSFYMNVREVTNRQYWQIMAGHWPDAKPKYWDDPKFNNPFSPDDRPVVGVDWDDAMTYCNLVGKRLPTEAEWERAARGGQVSREFPWGNTVDRSYGNFAGIGGSDVWENTAPVCSFLPNDYGVFDIIGNAYEWCSDYYEFYYYTMSENNNPVGPTSGATRVLRGGSCYDGFYPSYLRSATRYSYSPSPTDGIVGFRCAMDVP